tara:strand:+ start:1468 stop:1824 length:357 start_codon:yes stop_codon:yes gene_type:complete
MESVIKKGIILSTSKNNHRVSYVFKKEQIIIDCFNDILNDLGIDFDPEYSLKDQMFQSLGTIKLDDIRDVSYPYKNEEYSVEFFIGDTRIILAVLSNEDRQEEISEVVNKYADFEDKK